MPPLEFLARFPGAPGFSRKSLVLIFAYYLRQYRGATTFKSGDVRDCFKQALLNPPTNLGALLKSLSKGKEAPLLRARPAGTYAISLFGVNEVEAVFPSLPAAAPSASPLLTTALPLLRRTIAKIRNPQRQDFLAEAISCLEVGARRATVILSWIAALDHMYEYVLNHGLGQFNAALGLQPGKVSKLVVSTREHFGEMKESDFITVCRSAAIITNDVRKILEEKLGFRNSCAHPSSIAVGDSKVLSFVEDLVDNVFSKHPI